MIVKQVSQFVAADNRHLFHTEYYANIPASEFEGKL